MRTEFSERLKIAMNLRGVTAYAIGRDTSVSKQSTMGYLKGRSPLIKAVITLSEYLSVGLMWLATGTGNMEKNSNPGVGSPNN